jgi:hypothetical protein
MSVTRMPQSVMARVVGAWERCEPSAAQPHWQQLEPRRSLTEPSAEPRV